MTLNEAATEIEVVDSISGDRLAAAVDRRQGGKFLLVSIGCRFQINVQPTDGIGNQCTVFGTIGIECAVRLGVTLGGCSGRRRPRRSECRPWCRWCL